MYDTKLIIAGSRDMPYRFLPDLMELCDQWVKINGLPSHVLSGACPTGVDAMGEIWAYQNDIEVLYYPYAKNLGKAGGPIRNSRMVRDCGGAVVMYSTRVGPQFDRGSKDVLHKAQRKFILDPSFVISKQVDYSTE